MAQLQAGRLQRAVADARRSPFWADHLGGLRIESIHDLASIPVLDKPALRSAPEQTRLTAPIPAGSRTLRTSGTTGEPFAAHYSPRGRWYQGVLQWRADLNWGVRPWHRRVMISLLAGGGPSAARRLTRWVQPVFLSSDRPVDELIEAMDAHRPAVISGYPHVLLEIADHLGTPYQPKVLITHGETLAPEVRAELADQYGVDPIDRYGTAEAGFVAWQCRARDLYHVNHEAVIVEVVDGDGEPAAPGQTGDLVLTSLWNPLMPILRYRIGDAAAWADRGCRCGSPLPALAHITGRTYDWIVAADGRRVAPQRLWLGAAAGIEALDSVRRYRIRQDAGRRLHVDVVPTDRFTDDMQRQVAAAYQALLGPVPIEVVTVDRVTKESSGKFELIRSAASPETVRPTPAP